MGRDQARQPPVPVRDRVDREEVEDERADEQHRVGSLIGDGLAVPIEQVR